MDVILEYREIGGIERWSISIDAETDFGIINFSTLFDFPSVEDAKVVAVQFLEQCGIAYETHRFDSLEPIDGNPERLLLT